MKYLLQKGTLIFTYYTSYWLIDYRGSVSPKLRSFAIVFSLDSGRYLHLHCDCFEHRETRPYVAYDHLHGILLYFKHTSYLHYSITHIKSFEVFQKFAIIMFYIITWLVRE